MPELDTNDVRALARAAGVIVPERDLDEIALRLTVTLSALDAVEVREPTDP